MPNSIKLIKCVEDLPKSFCLDNYADTKQLDAAGWAAVLSERRWIQHQYIRLDPDLLLVADKSIRRLFKDPLHQKGSTEPDLIYASFMDLEGPPITHLAVHELYFLISFLESNKFASEAKEYKKFLDDFRDDPNTHRGLSKSAREFRFMEMDSMDEPPQYAFNTGKIHLSVDISCSDDQLINELIKALSNARKARDFAPRDKIFNQTHFDRWHRYAVLPFLDLTIWAKANGVTIPQHVMGEAILPNENSDTTEAIRKTVKPLASGLLQRETLRTLAAQCQGEKRKEL